MKRITIILFIAGFISAGLIAQTPVEVADNTLKIDGHSEELFYYGFAGGDQMIFSFEEVNGKEITEVEVTEMPASSKFMDYKTKKIYNKRIIVQQKSIYKFRFTNSARTARICKIKIQRIPATAKTANFNSSVYWRTVQDTSYLITKEKTLLKRDTTIQTLVEQNTRITGSYTIGGSKNKSYIDFTLPDGTVSWSFYIGVGSKGKEVYATTKSKFINTAASAASHIPGYGTMAALALYGVNLFTMVQGEDNVKYWFLPDEKNYALFRDDKKFKSLREGNVINEAAQMKKPLNGKLFLTLLNDNMVDAIDVMVNITAVVVHEQWAPPTRQIQNIQFHQEPYLKN